MKVGETVIIVSVVSQTKSLLAKTGKALEKGSLNDFD